MKLNTHDDPLQALLLAAELRQQAYRLEQQADLHERIAAAQLEELGIHPGVTVAQKDTILVVAYGGPANGTQARVPTKAFPDNIVLVANGAPFDYIPGVIFTVGNACPCALVVPKLGGLQAMFRDAANMGVNEVTNTFDPLATAIARTLIHGLGYHPQLMYQPIHSLARAARNPDVVCESPAIIQLQGAA